MDELCLSDIYERERVCVKVVLVAMAAAAAMVAVAVVVVVEERECDVHFKAKRSVDDGTGHVGLLSRI